MLSDRKVDQAVVWLLSWLGGATGCSKIRLNFSEGAPGHGIDTLEHRLLTVSLIMIRIVQTSQEDLDNVVKMKKSYI